MFPLTTIILIVDDQPSMLAFHRNELKKLGYQFVHEANDGVEALKILEENKDGQRPIQLVISDWHMPEKDGLQLLKEIRENSNYNNVAFIMVSAEREPDEIIKVFDYSIDNYISKPFTSDNMKRCLDVAWDNVRRSKG